MADLSLPFDLTAPALAREFLRSHVCVTHRGDEETLELLVSELVANAVRHGGPPVAVSVDCGEGAWSVGVTDGAPPAVSVRPQGNLGLCTATSGLPEGGRGLDLVEALSSNWRMTPAGAGKTVWVEVLCEDPI